MSRTRRVKRQQVLFRIWNDDLSKVQTKLFGSGLSMQRFFEGVVLEYLEGNTHLEDLAKKYRKLPGQRNQYEMDAFEAEKILKKIQEHSPLNDVDLVIQEMENEDDLSHQG